MRATSENLTIALSGDNEPPRGKPRGIKSESGQINRRKRRGIRPAGIEVEPSKGSDKKFLPIIATVKDQNNQPPQSPVTVHISLKVDPTSGGHDHGDSTRPRGGIAGVKTCKSDDECWSNTTDGNGQVVFNFNPAEASGTHTITATCDECTNTATKPVDVKVDGLETIPSSSFYTFIVKTDKHSDNHYLTPEAASVLWRMAVSYKFERRFKIWGVAPTQLHLNDASLTWGGKFDLAGKWVGFHYEHDRGNVVDVRANTAAGNIPEASFTDFENMAEGMGADAQLHCSAARDPSMDNCVGDENRHYHVILN